MLFATVLIFFVRFQWIFALHSPTPYLPTRRSLFRNCRFQKVIRALTGSLLSLLYSNIQINKSLTPWIMINKIRAVKILCKSFNILMRFQSSILHKLSSLNICKNLRILYSQYIKIFWYRIFSITYFSASSVSYSLVLKVSNPHTNVYEVFSPTIYR